LDAYKKLFAAIKDPTSELYNAVADVEASNAIAVAFENKIKEWEARAKLISAS